MFYNHIVIKTKINKELTIMWINPKNMPSKRSVTKEHKLIKISTIDKSKEIKCINGFQELKGRIYFWESGMKML